MEIEKAEVRDVEFPELGTVKISEPSEVQTYEKLDIPWCARRFCREGTEGYSTACGAYDRCKAWVDRFKWLEENFDRLRSAVRGPVRYKI
jgi:hypothetical protein